MLSHSCQSYHIACQIIWFTALSPYLVMAVLLGRALTLEGAGYGLLYYVSPQWDYLWRGRTWIDGATQIFFAYSVGSGALPALGSYNKFYHNCVKDTVITCFVNSGQNFSPDWSTSSPRSGSLICKKDQLKAHKAPYFRCVFMA